MVISLRNCTLFVRRTTEANAPPANLNQGDFLIVKFGEGNFTYNLTRNFNYEMDRGRLDDVRRGDETPIDITIGGKYEYVQSVPVATGDASPLLDAYHNQLTLQEAFRGKMFDGVTTHPWVAAGIEREAWLVCTPYCVALELHSDLRRECPDVDTPGEASLFRFFRAESVEQDTSAGTVSITGRANILRPLVLNPAPANWLYSIDPGTVPLPFVKGSGTWNWPEDRRVV